MKSVRTVLLAAGAAAFLSSQAAYAAPLVGQPSVDPLVSLSALASMQSAAAVCAGSTAATAGATAAAQAAAPGCVLPVTAPPPAPVAETAPPAPVVETAAAPKGIGTLPLLLALAAIIGIAALLLSSDNNGHGTPVSPA